MVVGAALSVVPFELPHAPFTGDGAVLKVAVTVQFAFTAPVVNEVPDAVPPQVLVQDVL